ncbi:MAG: PilN domain-containing protein [Candidatus Doudnabacteria bacterium]|nr:PilN domain-containing protein [Candidatus Doudnabacteria bacterium]
MKITNLLPQSELKGLRLLLASKLLVKFFIVIAISLTAFFLMTMAVRFYIEGSITESQSRIGELQRQLSSSDNQALEKQVLNLNTQIRNIKSANQQHYYWSKALVELGNITPVGMHLNTLDVDRASGKLVVEGVSDNRDDVITFWSNVTKSSYFQNINFPLNNLESAADTEFTFTFSIKPETIKTE